MRSSLEAGGAFPHAAQRPWGVSGGLSRLGCAASVVRLRRHPTTANAIGRSILVIIWHLLADPAARYTDLGASYYQTRTDTDRKLRNHIRQIQALGFEVTLTKTL